MSRLRYISDHARPVCLALAAALIACCIVAGCGSTRTTTAGTSTHAQPGFPVIITDAQGVQVTIPSRPTRIVSASPAVTEMLFALGAGDRVVAVTDQCNYPAEAARLAKIGGFWTPSVERVLGAQPDLVIGSRGNPPDFVTILRKSGVPVMTVDPQTLSDIFATIRRISEMIGDKPASEKLVASMQARLDAVADAIRDVPEDKRPTAFLVLQVTPPWTAGSGTFQDDAIRVAGGRNIASDLKSFTAYSTETLVAKDPDFLLLSTMNGDRERMKRDVLVSTALSHLSAVRSGHMVVLESDPLMRAGPRIVEAVEAMARTFYPGRFGDKSDGS